MCKNLLWLSDEQLVRIEPHLPTERRVERVDDRRVISGIVHVLKSGCRWLGLLARLRPLHDDLQWLQSLGRARHWQAIFEAPARCGKDGVT